MKVHLVDGTYELFRAWFGAPKKRTSRGREVGAARALLRMFARIKSELGATHVACAFDHVIESFRNAKYPGYKTGAGLDPELLGQFDLAERTSHALGFATWSMVEFEADDAIATGAKIADGDPNVEKVLICSPDKDLAQCVRGERIVCLDRFKNVVLNEDGVVAKFGVKPSQIPDWLALVGDAADGYPGIAKWGAVSASKLIARYGSLEAIPNDPSQWDVSVRGASALSASLESNRAEAFLFRELATLRTDVSLEQNVSSWEWKGVRKDELAALCSELEETEFRASF